MVTKISDSYSEYKRKEEELAWKHTKFILIVLLALFPTILLGFLNLDKAWDDAFVLSTLLSPISAGVIQLFASAFNVIEPRTRTNDFVFNYLKKKYTHCIRMNGAILFKSNDTFYKVETFYEVDGALQVISQETKPFHIDLVE